MVGTWLPNRALELGYPTVVAGTWLPSEAVGTWLPNQGVGTWLPNRVCWNMVTQPGRWNLVTQRFVAGTWLPSGVVGTWLPNRGGAVQGAWAALVGGSLPAGEDDVDGVEAEGHVSAAGCMLIFALNGRASASIEKSDGL